MKKILAVLLAFAMLFAFAACGGNNEDTTTTTAEDTTVAEETTVADETTAADETTTAVAGEETTAAADESTTTAADETTTAAGEETTLAEGETTTAAAPAAVMTKAEFVAFINAETAKIVKSGSYSLNRSCEYTTPIDVGGATGVLNGIIGLVDKNASVDTVVGGFLGIGTKTGNMPKDKDKVDKDYQLKATALKEADLGSFSANNGVYTFTLANATDPKKTGATPIARFTNDFITHEEVSAAITEKIGDKITLTDSTVNYKNIKVSVTVANGKITNIKYSYDFSAALALKAGITINGTGAAVTTGTYSNIKY